MLHDSALTLHWSELFSLDALVISPDLFKANHPHLPLVFIMPVSNSKFQFLPPSFSQFATQLHPTHAHAKMRRLSDKGQQKHLERRVRRRGSGGGGRSALITVLLNVSACLSGACAHRCNIMICVLLGLIFDLAFSSTHNTCVTEKKKTKTPWLFNLECLDCIFLHFCSA